VTEKCTQKKTTKFVNIFLRLYSVICICIIGYFALQVEKVLV